jgi:archaellum component FlaG (FlaF/FlaG flagellin family)
MKNLKNCFWGLFFVVAVAGQLLHGAQAVVESVDQKMSLLNQIIEHVNTIVDSPNQGNRSRAKRELTKLMNNKELDAKIKDAIKSDIEIIKNGKTTYAVNAAFQRLLATYNKINAQADVVDIIAEWTEKVKNASPEELEENIVQAKKRIKEAQELLDQEQGILKRWYSKAKRTVITPVNYVFGEESSYAKTAFYAAVGAAILAAGVYAAY